MAIAICDENDSIDWQSDVRDSTACFLEPVAYPNSSSSDLTGMKIGIPTAFSIEGCPKQVHQA